MQAMLRMRRMVLWVFVTCSFIVSMPVGGDEKAYNAKPASVARQWTESLLFAIRRDLARPTVHARNLHHLSVVMFDAWALYEHAPTPFFVHENATLDVCRMASDTRDEIKSSLERFPNAAEIALGYAAWTLLEHRFKNSRWANQILKHFDSLAADQGLIKIESPELDLGDPASVGVQVARCVIEIGLLDGANENLNYENRDYQPVNDPLDPTEPGNPNVRDPNRWQPLMLETFIDQSGNVTATPTFLSAEWGEATPFALSENDRSTVRIDEVDVPVWLDPGEPPVLSEDEDIGDDSVDGINENTGAFQQDHALVVEWSEHLDPDDGVMIDISPAAIGNLGNLQTLPISQSALIEEYDARNGGMGRATGHAINPHTGVAYTENLVPRGDYTRVLAEFWADGPDSETPPGHWFSVYNEAVVSHPQHETRVQGVGEAIDPLAYDVLAYLALGGALHDSAIAAWSTKRAYDSSRPITAIRYMASLGQSTDRTANNYHPKGIPLKNGVIETVMAGDALAKDAPENVGKIKARTWRGPNYVSNPTTDKAGVDWILLENWWPYQRPSFVTPPFAGYVSGHSTFSRAAAEVLTALTGDPFFPGGLAEFLARKDEFLVFEQGPSVDVRLQWATYRDAADQTSLSRIWGGIHPPADDVVGRRMGEQAGKKAWQKALQLFQGGISKPDNAVGNDALVSVEPRHRGCLIAVGEQPSELLLFVAFLCLGRLRRRVRKFSIKLHQCMKLYNGVEFYINTSRITT